MMPKPSPISYNLFALFFAFCGAVTLYLLAGGDTAPEIRLSFAVCGMLTVYAATMGGLFRHVKIKPAAFRVPVWGRVVLVLLATGAWILWQLVSQLRESYADTFAKSGMTQHYMALEEYAKKHNGTLPPDMRSDKIARYLGIRFRTADTKWHGQPYVWNNKLAGKKIAAFPERANVVVLYSQPITKRKTRVVLFLNGRTDYGVSAKELTRLLRESDTSITAAKRSKQAKPNPAKPSD
ncbi:MAG: hypothetical protein H7Y38_17335 [Armatimonadetes bacterium]|nr:hypothetical protein [Armatimonadota bacterium]